MSFFKSNNPFRHADATGGASSSSSNVDDVAPPPGPPPSHSHPPPQRHQQEEYAPPPGPPPSHPSSSTQRQDYDYAPPPGPPPPPSYYSTTTAGDYAQQPPPGPPPQQQQQHDWQSVVPDTSLFPPPPALFSGYDRSAASNASEQAAEEGERWCRRYPLAPPMRRQDNMWWQFSSQRDHDHDSLVSMVRPDANTFCGRLACKEETAGGGGGGGVWSLVTEKKGGDTCVMGYPPVYLVQRDSPLLASSSSTKTIYYEVKILGPSSSSSSSSGGDHHHRSLFHHHSGSKGGGAGGGNNKEGEIGLALGFTALPYPPFRMPGWHRGSLAVHGDDGNRFTNDRWGGKDFTRPFKPGETVGIGMKFSSSGASPPSYSGKGKAGGESGGSGTGGRIEAEVFFTRDGKVDGRWDVHEELDASTDLPVTGLEGYHDLAIAVGTYQNVAVDIVLDPARWMYRGVQN